MERLLQASDFWPGVEPLKSQDPVSSSVTSKCTEKYTRRWKTASKEGYTKPHRKKCVINVKAQFYLLFSLILEIYCSCRNIR